MSKTFLQITLIFFKETTQLIFDQSLIKVFKTFIQPTSESTCMGDKQSLIKLGVEIFAAVIEYTSTENVHLFIELMLNDDQISILSLLDTSTDSSCIKALN